MRRFTIHDALFGRDARPILSRTTSVDRAWDASGPLTAFEAYDIAERRVRDIDADYTLASIASDEPVADDGRSDAWRIEFHLPVRRGVAVYQMRAARDEVNGSLLGSVEIDLELAPAGLITNDREMASSIDASGRTLPVPFQDSSQALRTLPFVAREVSFVSMRTETDAGGRPVWRIAFGAETHDLPLAA